MNDVISAIKKSHFGKSIDEDFLLSLKMLTENKMVAADVIKRPESIMDDALLRFPHLGESIFEQLDNESLAKSREVCNFWKIFINDQKLPWIRMIKRYIKFLIRGKSSLKYQASKLCKKWLVQFINTISKMISNALKVVKLPILNALETLINVQCTVLCSSKIRKFVIEL